MCDPQDREAVRHTERDKENYGPYCNFRTIRFYLWFLLSVPTKYPSLQRYAYAVTKSNKRYTVQDREVNVYWLRCLSAKFIYGLHATF